MDSLPILRYDIAFLRSFSNIKIIPDKEKFDAFLTLITELGINIQEYRKPPEPLKPRNYTEKDKYRPKKPYHRKEQSKIRWGSGKHHVQQPNIKPTRMPDKSEKSKVLSLLNKLGKDNVDNTAAKLLEFFKEDSETTEGLALYLAENTIRQVEIIGTFSLLWNKLFEDSGIKKVYMDFCKKCFMGFTYGKKVETSEKLSGFTTDKIYNITLMVTELYKLKAISWKPLDMMAQTYILHADNTETMESIFLIFDIMPPSSKKRYVSQLSRENQEKLLKDIVFGANKKPNIQKVHIFILRLLLSDKCHRQILSETVGTLLGNEIQNLGNGEKLSENMKALYMLLSKVERIQGVDPVILQFVQEKLSDMIQKMTYLLEKDESVVDCILPVLQDSGIHLELKIPLVVKNLLEKTNSLKSDKSIPMKWRFKFMDIIDLKGRNWCEK